MAVDSNQETLKPSNVINKCLLSVTRYDQQLQLLLPWLCLRWDSCLGVSGDLGHRLWCIPFEIYGVHQLHGEYKAARHGSVFLFQLLVAGSLR